MSSVDLNSMDTFCLKPNGKTNQNHNEFDLLINCPATTNAESFNFRQETSSNAINLMGMSNTHNNNNNNNNFFSKPAMPANNVDILSEVNQSKANDNFVNLLLTKNNNNNNNNNINNTNINNINLHNYHNNNQQPPMFNQHISTITNTNANNNNNSNKQNITKEAEKTNKSDAWELGGGLINLNDIQSNNQRTTFGNNKNKPTTSLSTPSQFLPEISSYGYNKPDLTSFSQINPLNMNYAQPNVNMNLNLRFNPTLNNNNQFSNLNNNIGPF